MDEKSNLNKRIKFIMRWVVLCTSLIILSGCSHDQEVINYRKIGPEDKINMPIRLYLSKSLSLANIKVPESFGFGTNSDPILGQTLVKTAKYVTEKIFTNVSFSANRTPKDIPLMSAELVGVSEDLPTWAFGDQEIAVSVKWTLEDSEGRLVWGDTIQGLGVSEAGNIGTARGQVYRRMESLAADLFNKTSESLTNSHEIKNLAKRFRSQNN